MFTPPPSPLPACKSLPSDSEISQDTPSSKQPLRLPSSMSSQDSKRRAARRLRLAVLLVPLAVILFTAYETYLATHISEGSPTTSSQVLPLQLPFHELFSEARKWRPHRRDPSPLPQTLDVQSSGSLSPSSSSTSNTPTSTLASVGSQPLPTVPSSPPVLPTPFPQPFGIIGQNFSSISCSNFFTNMTGSSAFRTCRPFSLLLSTSGDFINAQSNLTLMNSLIWGTCNTKTDNTQCQANMGWFASALKTSCSDELSQNNALATSTLTGLNAFQVMHDTACLSDPTTNSYCYINAVRNTNPVDLYYYQLPLGIGLPQKAVPSCSACSRSLMNVFGGALENSTTAPLLTGLRATYDNASATSVQLCGGDFSKTDLVSAATSSLLGTPSVLVASLLSLVTWMVLFRIS